MLDSRATSDTRDNGSTVTFNIPNGVNAQTETQTAVLQLLEFQGSHSIYNIDSTNNKLEIFVQFYDTTGLALSNTKKSTVISILPGNYGASDLVTALNAAINTACKPVKRTSPGSTNTTLYYYSAFGNNSYCSASSTSNQPVSLNMNTGKINFNFPVVLSELSNHSSATSTYSNTTFNSNIYSGFYLLSDNYPGLLLTLGFTTNDFELLPTATLHSGVGVQLIPTVTYASSVTTVTYKINTAFPNLNMDTKYYTIDTSGNITTPDIIDLSIRVICIFRLKVLIQTIKQIYLILHLKICLQNYP